MSTSLLFSLTLNWALQQISSWSSTANYWSFNKNIPPPRSCFLSGFWEKKSDKENILYLMEVDETVVIASVFYFSIVDEHAKIICIGTARGLYLIKRQQTCKRWVLLWFNFTGTVCEDELITSSNKGYCHRKCFFFSCFNENEINLLYFC